MNALWAATCEALRVRIGDQNFAAWIAPLRPVPGADGLALDAPDGFTRDRVARHFLSAIEAALADAAGRRVAVRLGVALAPAALPIPELTPTREPTFARFVLGESNAPAVAAARAVGSSGPAVLCLHGPSGVGKTHLLHAVFHALADVGRLSACLSAAQLAAAHARNDAGPFFAALAPFSALLVDDLHAVPPLGESRPGLAAGLVDWIDGGRTLVVTCDRPPTALPGVANPLRERLTAGTVAAIAAPDPRLSSAILDEKARALGFALDPGVASRLAGELGGDVRRLEGALTRIVACAQLSGRTIDAALVDEVLPVLRRRRPGTITVGRIAAVTAEAFGTSPRALRGSARRRDLVIPRQVMMYVARELLGRSFASLAPEFARDHTTLRHAWRATLRRRAQDPALDALVSRVVHQLREEEEG